MEELLVLIDGNSLINRAFYAVTPMTTSEGRPTNAVYGFVTMLLKMIHDLKPRYIGVCFDMPHPTFRHKRYPLYKATRKGMPDELACQLAPLKDILRAMNITVLELAGVEADDILGTVAKRFSEQTIILTGDRDCLQLVDASTKVFLTKRGLSEIAEVSEFSLSNDPGITPTQIIELKALQGDSSDNIPGIAGVGEKTALTLIKEYGTIDNLYDNIDKLSGKLRERVENGRESAFLSRELATIDINVDIPCKIENMIYDFPFGERVKEMFQKLEFRSLLKRPELFAEDVVPAHPVHSAEIRTLKTVGEIAAVLDGATVVALTNGDEIHLAVSPDIEYILTISNDLFCEGVSFDAARKTLSPLLADDGVVKVVFDYKQFLRSLGGTFKAVRARFDVQLAQYLSDYSVGHDSLIKWLAARQTSPDLRASALFAARLELDAALKKDGMDKLFYDVELPLQDVLVDMEETGFCVDTEALDSLSEQYAAELDVLQSRIFELAGEEFNINSPRQLGNILFDKLGLPSGKKSKRGDYSTGAEILEMLDDNEIVRLILKYRTLAKLSSTYIEGLKRQIRSGGVVHTEFKQTVTATGRLSSVEPNLQNIPVREEEGRVLRKLFRAREGNRLITADYSQIELRLLAHLSQDPILLAAYASGDDIHTATAAQVFGVAIPSVTSEMRRAAKAVNFGIIYGISEFGLAKQLGVTSRVARQYIQKYFATYPKVKEYMTATVETARQTGRAVSMFGRVRNIPEIKSVNHNIRSFGERAAMNMPLQSTGADLIKIAMLNVRSRLAGMKSKLILQVHDELIVDAAIDEIDRVVRILREEMESAAILSVPLVVDIGIGENWFSVDETGLYRRNN